MAVDLVAVFMNLVKAGFALAVFAYAVSLYKIFRGGVMQGAFRFFLVAPLFFAVTEFLNMLKNDGIVFIANQKLVADSFELLFLAALFLGFYRLTLVWKVKR